MLLLSLVSLVPAVYCHKHIFPAPVAQLSLVVGGGREKEEEGHMCVSEIVCVLPAPLRWTARCYLLNRDAICGFLEIYPNT